MMDNTEKLPCLPPSNAPYLYCKAAPRQSLSRVSTSYKYLYGLNFIMVVVRPYKALILVIGCPSVCLSIYLRVCLPVGLSVILTTLLVTHGVRSRYLPLFVLLLCTGNPIRSLGRQLETVT